MQKEMSDEEIIALREAYQNDPTLQKINKAIAEIKENALLSGEVTYEGEFVQIYSMETNKALEFWRKHMEYHIRVNYPGLL